MTHDHEPQVRIGRELAARPLLLARRGLRQPDRVGRVIPEPGAQVVHEAKTHLGMDETVGRGGDRVIDGAVQEDGAQCGLRQPVAVECGDAPPADVETDPVGVKPHPDVAFPEVAAPAVVVAANHHDRHAVPQPRQRRRDMKAPARNHPGVGEPEVEQVAVDEQAVTEPRHRLQELQERLLDGGRRHAEMGVGHDDERMAQHGAKDGPLPPAWQPARRDCHSADPPSVTNPERPA